MHTLRLLSLPKNACCLITKSMRCNVAVRRESQTCNGNVPNSKYNSLYSLHTSRPPKSPQDICGLYVPRSWCTQHTHLTKRPQDLCGQNSQKIAPLNMVHPSTPLNMVHAAVRNFNELFTHCLTPFSPRVPNKNLEKKKPNTCQRPSLHLLMSIRRSSMAR